jgi:radical SAM protein with 4Fe4S-binding SPASM domain
VLRRIFPSEAAPAHVQVEVTWQCNWRCVHCYQDTHQARGPSTAQLLQLVDELAAAGTVHLIVTGGEPLVRPDLVEVLTAARRAGLGITLYTNGHIVGPALARTLGGLIAAAELSVLSGDDEIHDSLAGRRGAAGRVWRAATLLRAEGVAVTIKTPLLKPALGTHRRIAERSAGMDWHPDADISGTYGGAAYPLQYRLSDDEIAQFYRDFPEYDPRSGYTTDPGVMDGICLAGRRYCFIDVDGNVYPCLNFKSAADRAQAGGQPSSVIMGNVFRRSFQQIWAAPIGAHIRARTGRDFRRCTDCTGQCSPCMAKNFEITGDLFDNGGSCLGATPAPAPVFLGLPRPVMSSS